MAIRFHLDEHASGALARALRNHGVDVSTTPDAGLVGASDLEQLREARRARRVLFTQDADFLRLHAEGRDHAGIVFGSQEMTLGEIVEGLLLVYYVLEPEEISGEVEFL